MTEWNEETAQDEPSLDMILVACRAAPIGMPTECPACRTVAAHAYFDGRHDPQLGSRLGSYWIWCDSCRRYTHGSIHAPAWWENLETVDRDVLDSLPDYLSGLTPQIDQHWQRLLLASR